MTKNTYDYERLEIPNLMVLDSADQFYDGAKILNELPPGSGVLLPIITNAALALELYIKALNVRSVIEVYRPYNNGGYGGRVKEIPFKGSHVLSTLLNSVIDEIKRDVDGLFNDGVITHSFCDLIDLVRPYDSLFVQVRYSYENDVLSNFNITELFECIEIVHDVITKITPIHRVIK
ncbi:hypothetical protein [Aeromonas veronii]|uniref:hypothetical protein n=1 Tax=Aeromonas veronii TaxID=654 RepID=UPI00191DCAE5|nr:hypothetical protein [Aeromonas veronii]MBL0564613.1 hypothetical protein [Aeromonas veronii]